MMKSKTWLCFFSSVALAGLLLVVAAVAWVDPYMHYHKPLTDSFYYTLCNQRSQNDGITKHFDYDAIITGTSMTENFKASEMDAVFGCCSIKVSYSGGSFKEINDNLTIALETHPDIRYIVRSLDRYSIGIDKDTMRTDLGKYPTYLYDKSLFNDVQYLLNKDVVQTALWGVWDLMTGDEGGITSFDEYSNWMSYYTFGVNSFLDRTFSSPAEENSMTEETRQAVRENLQQNVIALAEANPNTDFYCFLPPYSAAYWGEVWSNGELMRQMELEKYAASLIVPHENIHLFAWDRFDLWDDLNNFKDSTHYGEWINSWMLLQMKNGEGRLTEENYEEYFRNMYDHYSTFDYDSLASQPDYEDDYYAAELLCDELPVMP